MILYDVNNIKVYNEILPGDLRGFFMNWVETVSQQNSLVFSNKFS